ncbi:MAG TPA: ATP-binding cassette domain-containing protein, partial [Ramlibacter sp.]|nr:ATP-binding cassette domain-containing protein [Ramlibacter sp.]
MPAAAPLLTVQGLRVGFGGKEVVRGIDFAISPGEKLALVGESGSGKTVTALSLVRLAANAQVSGSARLRASSCGLQLARIERVAQRIA